MSVPKYWREIPRRYRLEAGQCTHCGSTFYPPRLVCSECKSREFRTVCLPMGGVVETFTVVRVPPSALVEQAPYVLAVVRLADGTKLLTQLVDCEPEQLTIGMPVRLEFRRIFAEGRAGIICYGHKAVPE
ncbi:MAG: Zn-ribbon domain-containing OB-fold protein [Calditrichaeota bacterium]|nr:Zn-ribbon domain-containing OB-fold protein [Calditrichota bacterium]